MEPANLLLAKIRIHGYGEVIDSSWFEVGNHLTYIVLPSEFNRKGFLEALQTINPPYICDQEKPFQDYSSITRQGKYQKRVRPNRRTIAFSIFNAQSSLVKELAEITPVLYETDRIEIGRRMDCSRWINFVEIASSTRWSEIEKEVMELIVSKIMPHDTVHQLVSTLVKSSRVTGDVRETLSIWLAEILEHALDSESKIKTQDIIAKVQREAHFLEARKIVEQHLPLFMTINTDLLRKILFFEVNGWTDRASGIPLFSSMFLGNQYQALDVVPEGVLLEISSYGIFDERIREKSTIDIIKEAMKYCIFICRELFKTQPIFLIDEPDLHMAAVEEVSLRELCHNLSDTYQCVYLVLEDTVLNENRSSRILTVQDLKGE